MSRALSSGTAFVRTSRSVQASIQCFREERSGRLVRGPIQRFDGDAHSCERVLILTRRVGLSPDGDRFEQTTGFLFHFTGSLAPFD
jgi:hypothetical protein